MIQQWLTLEQWQVLDVIQKRADLERRGSWPMYPAGMTNQRLGRISRELNGAGRIFWSQTLMTWWPKQVN